MCGIISVSYKKRNNTAQGDSNENMKKNKWIYEKKLIRLKATAKKGGEYTHTNKKYKILEQNKRQTTTQKKSFACV